MISVIGRERRLARRAERFSRTHHVVATSKIWRKTLRRFSSEPSSPPARGSNEGACGSRNPPAPTTSMITRAAIEITDATNRSALRQRRHPWRCLLTQVTYPHAAGPEGVLVPCVFYSDNDCGWLCSRRARSSTKLSTDSSCRNAPVSSPPFGETFAFGHEQKSRTALTHAADRRSSFESRLHPAFPSRAAPAHCVRALRG